MKALLALLLLTTAPLPAQQPTASASLHGEHYHDEASQRQLRLRTEGGKVLVEVRFADVPGSQNYWRGSGNIIARELHFAADVGEGQDRGTFFTAELGMSKIRIGFKEGQRNPQEAGISGIYRSLSSTKRTQLASRELKATQERLASAQKMAAKSWSGDDREVIGLWKRQWPSMQQAALRALGLKLSTPSDAGSAAANPGANAPKPNPDDAIAANLALAQITSAAAAFFETPTDNALPGPWDGQYNDFFGGSANLQLAKDGRLRVTLSSAREPGQEASSIDATVPASAVRSSDKNRPTAEFIFKDTESATARKPAQFKLRRLGRFLHIESLGGELYAGAGWFDGFYRGMALPPP